MSMTRYDPFRDLRALQDEMNRLFTSNLSRSFGDESIVRGAWAPNVDIYEYKNGVLRVVLQKREEVKPRRIQVGGDDDATPAQKTVIDAEVTKRAAAS